MLNMKKFLLVLCMTACLFGLTACSSSDDTSASNNSKISYDEESYKSAIMDDLKTLSESSDEEIALYIENADSDGVAALIESWKTTSEEVGQINGFSDWTFSITEDDSLEVTVLVDCTLHDMDYKIVFTKNNEIDYATFNVKYTLAEKMTKAGLNTIIGICLVFAVLILISFIISLFKYISVFEQKMKDRKSGNAGAKEMSAESTIAQIVQREEEEYTDDLELVAVIAAAIAASEGVSPDGLVVRSIRKVNKKRWQNA